MAENDIWTIKAALDWTESYLGRKGDAAPRVSAQWLLSEATGLSRIDLYTSFDKPLSLEEREVLRGYVTRRGKGEPLQYITGEVAFRHIMVKVRPGVLIPRPETEVLVSEALALLPEAPRRHAADGQQQLEALVAREFAEAPPAEQRQMLLDQPQLSQVIQRVESQGAAPSPEDGGVLVADICTGSGCIACSIAVEHPQATVVATDISPDALFLARQNVQLLGLGQRVTVLESDLGQAVDPQLMGSFDLIVSNPPYVPTAVMRQLPREVADFEPALALEGGADGLDLYRRLLPWTMDALKPGGGFAFELHETCLDAAADLARHQGFADVCVVQDLTHRPRVLVARKA